MIIGITAKKVYGDRTVLEVENLAFERGKCYALIGANGSGKSTLLTSLDKQIPFEGARTLESGARIAYMPQSSYAFALSVKRNILLTQAFKSKAECAERYNYLVTALGLASLTRKNASKLSGGETQRVALARTLMAGADILILDEPTAAMDVEQAQAVMDLLKEENKRGVTVIFATHSLKQAEELADEVLFMANGVVVERGEPSKLMHEPVYSQTKAFIGFNR